MGKINMQKVLLGGLLAGLVLNVADFLLWGVLWADDMAAAMESLGKPAMGGSTIAWFVFVDFLYGIALVWAYAAIRPRFGASAKTAVYAGLFTWVLIGLLHAASEMPMGIFPQGLMVMATLIYVVLLPVAAVVGATIYTEA